MLTLRIRLRPRTAFGSLIKGDTLFGQLCWAIRNRFGGSRLTDLLQGYIQDKPFAVVSDAFPSGHVPRPTIPMSCYDEVEGADRKAVKNRSWMPLGEMNRPISTWLEVCKPASEVCAIKSRVQQHNVIDRRTGTTGEGFAPYGASQIWYPEESELDCHVVLDDSRLSMRDLECAFVDIGCFGYGRDASIGLGKFCLTAIEPSAITDQANANAYLTLAPCAPQGMGFAAQRSYYQPFTRFGRHGDIAVLDGKPFKTPVLLAQTGAVFSPGTYAPKTYIGQGLGGGGSLSKAIPETVHQGYAPVVKIHLPDIGGAST